MECEQVRIEWRDYVEPCCDSCHEDDEMGYGDDLWFEIAGRERNVCCAVSRSVPKEKPA